SSSPWTYTQWPNNNVAQQDGDQIRLEARGQTSDGGKGNPATEVTFTVSKLPPSVVITAPVPGSSVGDAVGFNNFSVSATDNGPGVSSVTVTLADIGAANGSTPNPATYFYWTGSSWSVVAATVFNLSTKTVNGPQMQFSPAGTNESINFTNFTT